MDNLLNSVLFTLATANCKAKVKTQGMLQKSGQGAPPCVMQEEVKGKAAEAIHGTVKAAVLKVNPRAEGVVVASIFDQTPFYMISNDAKEITWVVKEKKFTAGN